MVRGNPRCSLRLKDAVVIIPTKKKNTFKIKSGSKTLYLKANNNDELNKWLFLIRNSIKKYKTTDEYHIKTKPLLEGNHNQIPDIHSCFKKITDLISSLENKFKSEVHQENIANYEFLITQCKIALVEAEQSILMKSELIYSTGPQTIANNIASSHQCLFQYYPSQIINAIQGDVFYDAIDCSEVSCPPNSGSSPTNTETRKI